MRFVPHRILRAGLAFFKVCRRAPYRVWGWNANPQSSNVQASGLKREPSKVNRSSLAGGTRTLKAQTPSLGGERGGRKVHPDSLRDGRRSPNLNGPSSSLDQPSLEGRSFWFQQGIVCFRRRGPKPYWRITHCEADKFWPVGRVSLRPPYPQ